MKVLSYLLSLIVLSLFLTSCSENIIGTWSISKYETRKSGNPDATLNNIGTIVINEDGTGKNMLNYEVIGTARNDTVPFSWQKTDNYVTIESQDEEFDKTWLLIEDKKNSQIWKTTSGSGDIQILELTR